MGLVNCWCMCDHARSYGKYPVKEPPEKEASPTKGRQTKWEK
jgi:hypothetical protein